MRASRRAGRAFDLRMDNIDSRLCALREGPDALDFCVSGIVLRPCAHQTSHQRPNACINTLSWRSNVKRGIGSQDPPCLNTPLSTPEYQKAQKYAL